MGRYWIALAVVLVGLSLPSSAIAGEPGWVGQVVKPPSQREQIRETPMIYRPYRPLHFYGNTVRRIHYHGRVLPLPSDIRAEMRAYARAH